MYLNPTPARPRPPNQNHRVDVDPDRPRRETRARGPSFASADADVVDGVVAARARETRRARRAGKSDAGPRRRARTHSRGSRRDARADVVDAGDARANVARAVAPIVGRVFASSDVDEGARRAWVDDGDDAVGSRGGGAADARAETRGRPRREGRRSTEDEDDGDRVGGGAVRGGGVVRVVGGASDERGDARESGRLGGGERVDRRVAGGERGG